MYVHCVFCKLCSVQSLILLPIYCYILVIFVGEKVEKENGRAKVLSLSLLPQIL